jgi:hypothetical protein
MRVVNSITPWGWFWISWMAVAVAVEFYWVAVNTANTLSYQFWGAEQIDLAHPLNFAEWTPVHWIITAVIWVFFAWLSVHFPFGWLR